jgi:hypothetical protein
MVHSFLMIGQSNMAGRGRIGEVPPIENDRLFMLRNGRWQPLREPVNYDRPFAGLSLAVSFADEYARRFDCPAGLIPCADGGTGLEDWSAGGPLYDNAVAQTKLAQRCSEVKGILWHQGEEDSGREETARTYGPRFLERLSALRRACDLEHIPVIMGELGSFLADDPQGRCAYFRLVNQALADIAKTHPGIALADSAGLGSNGDYLHFNAEALREFGKRYFRKYMELAG